MRALVLDQPGLIESSPLQEREWPLPAPSNGEIRIRVRACGICRTDLHIVEGEIPLPVLPLIPGHQVVGFVEAGGKHSHRFREGDRVGVPWLYHTCQSCSFCSSGQENLCDRAGFTGYTSPGGFAEYLVVSEDFAYPIPSRFSDEAAAPLLCAGVIGYRAMKISGLLPGERVALYGFGNSAHIAIQIARYWGCEVHVFTRSRRHRDLARRLGAAWSGSLAEAPEVEVDRAIIFAPAGELVPASLKNLRKGGVLALAGIYMSPIPSFDYGLLYQERVIRSVANSTRQDARELLEIASGAAIETQTESFELRQANQALKALKESRINGGGVLLID
jgi:alcohol dehydrogenase, propanol-preferring